MIDREIYAYLCEQMDNIIHFNNKATPTLFLPYFNNKTTLVAAESNNINIPTLLPYFISLQTATLFLPYFNNKTTLVAAVINDINTATLLPYFVSLQTRTLYINYYES
jgi:hypothetical protein